LADFNLLKTTQYDRQQENETRITNDATVNPNIGQSLLRPNESIIGQVR